MAAPKGGWAVFLATYDDRRHEFETRHPALRTFRIVALAALGFLPVGVTVSLVLSYLPTGSQGWIEGHPPTEPLPTAFIAVLAAAVVLILGFLAYGLIRWHEDRIAGQVALAIGLGGLVGALAFTAGCVLDTTVCLWVPAGTVSGVAWLAAWLVLGLLLDYRAWSRGETPG